MRRHVDAGILSPAPTHADSNGFLNRLSAVRIGSGSQDSRNLVKYAEKLDILSDRTAGPDACWVWAGGRTPDGYGRLYSGNRDLQAHRCALEVDLGRGLAPGMCALHACDNPPCVNPAHLFEGTKAVNNADCKAKGRTSRGERNGASKLTEAQVAAIRLEAAVGSYGIYRRLAREYGISSRMVSYIATGKRWTHLSVAP